MREEEATTFALTRSARKRTCVRRDGRQCGGCEECEECRGVEEKNVREGDFIARSMLFLTSCLAFENCLSASALLRSSTIISTNCTREGRREEAWNYKQNHN